MILRLNFRVNDTKKKSMNLTKDIVSAGKRLQGMPLANPVIEIALLIDK